MRCQQILSMLAVLAFPGIVKAQDVSIGFQPTVSYLNSNLGHTVNHPLGTGIGAHLQFQLHKRHAILPRLDYLQYKFDDQTHNTKIQNFRVGIDHNYYLGDHKNQGLYITAGLGYSSLKFSDRTTTKNNNESRGSVYFGGGLGYMFTKNVGLEMKYDECTYHLKSLPNNDKASAPTFNTSAIIRF